MSKSSNSINDVLRKAVSAGSYVTVRRLSVTEEEWYGYLIQIERELIAGIPVDEFMSNGIEILRVGDISDLVQDDSTRFYDFVLKQEGVSSVARREASIQRDLRSWTSVVRSVSELDAIIVESQSLPDDKFYLGRPVSVSEVAVWLRGISPDGRLDRELTEIDLSSVTSMRFHDRYSTMFGRYALRHGRGEPGTDHGT